MRRIDLRKRCKPVQKKEPKLVFTFGKQRPHTGGEKVFFQWPSDGELRFIDDDPPDFNQHYIPPGN